MTGSKHLLKVHHWSACASSRRIESISLILVSEGDSGETIVKLILKFDVKYMKIPIQDFTDRQCSFWDHETMFNICNLMMMDD